MVKATRFVDLGASIASAPYHSSCADGSGTSAGALRPPYSRRDPTDDGAISISLMVNATMRRIFDKATSYLATLAQFGKPLFGIQEDNDGKVVIFGGGIPIMFGGNITGAVGASAGTVEQDIAVADAGAAAFIVTSDHPNRL